MRGRADVSRTRRAGGSIPRLSSRRSSLISIEQAELLHSTTSLVLCCAWLVTMALHVHCALSQITPLPTSRDDKWEAAKHCGWAKQLKHCGWAKQNRISDIHRLRSSLQFRYINNQSLLHFLNNIISGKREAMIFGTRPGLSKLGPVSSLDIGGDVAVREKHQNPWCPSWSNNIHGQSSEGINQSMQLPHPCSPTRPPRPDTRISQVDRPRPRNISSRLLQLAAVRHLQVQISTNYSACRVILRESCSKLLGDPARGPCSNSFTGSRFSKGSYSRWHLLHSTWNPPKSLPILYSLLDNYTPSRNLRSEGQHLLRIPLRRSAAARCSFCFGAPTVWNSLKFENSRSRLTRVIQDTS